MNCSLPRARALVRPLSLPLSLSLSLPLSPSLLIYLHPLIPPSSNQAENRAFSHGVEAAAEYQIEGKT